MDRYLAQMRAANQALRSGDPDPSGLQEAMKPTTEDVTVFRSVPLTEFGDARPQDLQGFVVRDAGFFPASAAPLVPAPGEVRMTIDVPAGIKAAGSPDTSELILDAGTELSVDEVTVGPDGSAEMHLTALPGDSAAGPAESRPASESPGAAIDSMPPVLQNDEAGREWQRRTTEQVAAAVNGTYGGLNVEVTSATPFYGGPEGENRGFSVRIRITDADGNEVGHADRAIYRDDDGNLAAVHELLELDPEVRGQGFAAEFNRHLTDWYRQQGVERIELTANIDVGGYAWASHGYDFADEQSAGRIAQRLMEAIDSAPPDVRASARDVLSRFDRPFGSDGYPTPFEISRLGRESGAMSWLGKDVLLGSSWEGVKWLDRPTPASRS